MLDGRFRFENFVIGTANRLAASAARAVAESPGAVYNPLFVYSHAGLGKTHLLASIGVRARELHPALNIEYVPIDDFVEQLHAAISSGQAHLFKQRYHSVDLLLLDDVQFLTGRIETQSEVLRLLNALQQRGKQIVMASDRPPSEIGDVDERLLARLSGGLIVDIGAPDYETRLAILRHKCGERRTQFASGVLEELARSPAQSVREMQGALNRLVAEQEMLGAPLASTDVWPIVGVARTPPVDQPNEFEAFLQDIAETVAASVDNWRTQLSERIAYWSGHGFRTAILERALQPDEPVDVAEMDAAFSAVVDRLRALQRSALKIDQSFASDPVFRDPEQLAQAEQVVEEAILRAAPLPEPRPGFRLLDLTRCAANQLAMQALAAVIDEPATRYNPLFVHGPHGAGKSHAAHAVGHALRTRFLKDPSRRVRVAYVEGAALVNELVTAVHEDTLDQWRARYRAADALVVDGIEALDGKELSQEEFFHLFNALHAGGRQIVLFSDRPLSAFRGLESRLRTRFEGGLVVHLGAPPVVDRSGRHTPVPEGDEAAAPTIEGDAAEPRATPTRTSTTPKGDSFFYDSEKMLAEWPDAEGRLMEELI